MKGKSKVTELLVLWPISESIWNTYLVFPSLGTVRGQALFSCCPVGATWLCCLWLSWFSYFFPGSIPQRMCDLPHTPKSINTPSAHTSFWDHQLYLLPHTHHVLPCAVTPDGIFSAHFLLHPGQLLTAELSTSPLTTDGRTGYLTFHH